MSGIPTSPGAIVADLLFRRNAEPKMTFLVLEGPDDSRFWRSHICSSCAPRPAQGKPNLVEVMRRLEHRNIPGVIAVADEDCDSLLASDPPPPNTVFTDGPDLEGMLMMGPGLEKVLAELGEPERIARFDSRTGTNVRAHLFARGRAWGALRLLNRVRAAGVKFDRLAHSRFVDERTWEADVSGLLDEACKMGLCADRAQLDSALDTLPLVPDHRICQGHDLVAILAIGLHQVLGDNKASMVGDAGVASLLRAGTDRAYLRGTSTWADIQVWQGINAPFTVLRPDP